MAVGDNQGNVYTSNEGFGKAYILPDSNKALDMLPDYIDLEFKIRQANQKQKQAEQEAKKEKTAEYANKAYEAKQDWWWRHDQELDNEFNSAFNLGAEIQAKGLDPFTSNDPASQQFRKDLGRIETKGKLSKQLQEQYGADRKIIDEAKAKGIKLEEDTIVQNEEWYKTHDLNKVLDEGLLPPSLRYKDPAVNLEEVYRTAAGGIAKEGDVPFDQYLQIAPNTLSIPENKAMVTQQIADMPKAQQDALNIAAGNAGVSPQVYYSAKSIEAYRTKVPFKERFDKVFEDWKLGTETIGSGYETTSGVKSTTTETQLPYEKALQGAHGLLAVNPWIVDEWTKNKTTYQVLERDPKTKKLKVKETKTVVDAQTAAEALASMKLAQSDYKYNKDLNRKFFQEAVEAGMGSEEEIQKDRDLYEKMLRGKVDTWEELASYGINVGSRKGAIKPEDKRRLQDWSANQTTGLKMPGEETVIVSNYDDKDGKKMFTGVVDSGPDMGLYKDEQGQPHINWGDGLRFVKKKVTLDDLGNPVESYDFQTFSLKEGVPGYLESGDVDRFYNSILMGTDKEQPGKGLVWKMLNKDLYEVAPETGGNNFINEPETQTNDNYGGLH